MCIDACQMNFVTGIRYMQPVYLHRSIRNDEDITEIAHDCLMCGRCEEVCPVGIEISAVRMIQRRNKTGEPLVKNNWMGYFRNRNNVGSEKSDTGQVYNLRNGREVKQADVIYFAGCMTHLTPGIKEAMMKIFRASGEKVWFMDEEGGACCGRPLMLAGNDREARELINYNSEIIRKSGAKTLVTSCPICYNVFRDSYYLEAEVMHHTEYLKHLIDDGNLRFNYSGRKVVYHDPCELGRIAGIYDAPREVLSWVADLHEIPEREEKGLCCGGSLGNLRLNPSKKAAIASDAVKRLTRDNPEMIVTSCPLCKKTFSQVSHVKVSDIAEVTADEIAAVQVRKPRRPASVSLKVMVKQLLE